MRQLFRPIENVSLTLNIWTTTNHLTILGITIHYIDDMWNLHECVFAVEELCGSHGGVHMAKVLYEVLIDYNLTDKVRIFFNFCILFCTKYLSFLFCIVDNARNNGTMARSLGKLLKGSRSRFTKNYLTSCMTHVLNLVVQHGLKELGNEESYSNSEDDDKHLEGLEAIC